MAEDLIGRMARKRAEAIGKDWDSMSPRQKAKHYDAMWDALHVLTEPTDEMLDAATRTSTGTTMALDRAVCRDLFMGAVYKLLEIT